MTPSYSKNIFSVRKVIFKNSPKSCLGSPVSFCVQFSQGAVSIRRSEVEAFLAPAEGFPSAVSTCQLAVALEEHGNNTGKKS